MVHIRWWCALAMVLSGPELWAGQPAQLELIRPEPHQARAGAGGLAATPGTAGPLDLKRALATALEHNPEVAAERHAVEQARCRAREERLFPDPTFSIEAEEYRRFFHPGEGLVTSMVRQTVPTGGKRGFSIGIADGELALARSASRRRVWSVMARTKEAFFEALGALERLVVTRKLVALASEFHDVVSQRVRGGVVAPLEGTRAQVLLAQARVEEARAIHTVEASQQTLASLMGIQGTLPTTPVGALEVRPPLPALQELRTLGLAVSPEIETARLKQVVASKELGRARATRIPDLELGVGVAHDDRDPDQPRRYAASISQTLPSPTGAGTAPGQPAPGSPGPGRSSTPLACGWSRSWSRS
ncbi:MAG: TolC family protein [Candidatus Riflebacteria bacterium]|nr:TolC family protein [Candidatus Riflebacteria bacterium]